MRQSSVFRTRTSVLSSLILLAVWQQAWSADGGDGRFNYTIRASARYEGIENPRGANGVKGTEQLAQGVISTQLSRQTSRLLTNLNYQYSHLDYRKGLLQDRNLTTGSGTLTFIPVRDTLYWDVSHNRRMQTIDARLPLIQDNMQVMKTTSTGPRLTFNLGARNSVSSSYTYAKSATTFQSIFKQDRTTFNLTAMHQINSAFSTGVTYNEFQTTSENSPLASYDRKITVLNSQYLREKAQFYLDIGHVNSSSNLSSRHVNANMSYTPVSDTTIQLTYQDQVQDMFTNLLYARPGAFTDEDGEVALSTNLPQQYKVERATISLNHQIANALNYTLQYSTEDRTFASTSNNQSIDRLGLMFNMPVNDRLSVSAFGRDSDLYFQSTDRIQHRLEYGFSASWTLNTAFSLQFSINRVKQTGGLVFDNYDTSRAMIGFTYTISN